MGNLAVDGIDNIKIELKKSGTQTPLLLPGCMISTTLRFA
jgi:hypothetical protein